MLYSKNLEMTMIRTASLPDLKIVLDLLERQFAEHSILFETGELERALSELLSRKELGLVLLAEDEGRCLGMAAISLAWTLEYGGRTAWLDELYVLPEYRSAGIGSALIERTLLEARNIGCLAVDLEVDQDHTRAEDLYQRFGFERLPRSRWAIRLDDEK
jgi:GNAT superfamily N-acetyltransferase